eukprot:scaffold1336_cov100-Skeletonema_dohrnii-CCMP3373.AAC.8
MDRPEKKSAVDQFLFKRNECRLNRASFGSFRTTTTTAAAAAAPSSYLLTYVVAGLIIFSSCRAV